MDERFKTLALQELLPRIVRELKEEHRECARQYDVFFDSMMDVFAGRFKEDPEATLDRFLRLSDEECAWEKGDFRTRDTLLDNFIGREIARTLRGELEEYGYFDEALYHTWEEFQELPRLRKENKELGAELERLREKLNIAMRDNKLLGEEVSELKRSTGEEGLRVIEEKRAEAEELKREVKELGQRCRGLEDRLTAALMAPGAKRLAGMALILRAARDAHVTPAMLVERTGLKRYRVHELLKELLSLGLIRKITTGLYALSDDAPREDVELGLGRRLVRRWMSCESS